MQQYLDILGKIAKTGKRKKNRTGIDTFSITGAMFEHDMAEGFPLLTTKKMGMKNIATELQFFKDGLSSKSWLQERKCHIWDEWCNPQKVPYGNDEETKKKMASEDDLGRVYGVQWRKWIGMDAQQQVVIIDQLARAMETLKKDPTSRRIIVSAWNPAEINQMALPPCHYSFQVLSDGESLDLLWNQRSVDTPLGLPYNIASYALLLKLMAESAGMKPGKLIGFLADVHIYENQMAGVEEQLGRTPKALPLLHLPEGFNDIFKWEGNQFSLEGYDPHPAISFPIAV
jgi:thymidylate synthase